MRCAICGRAPFQVGRNDRGVDLTEQKRAALNKLTMPLLPPWTSDSPLIRVQKHGGRPGTTRYPVRCVAALSSERRIAYVGPYSTSLGQRWLLIGAGVFLPIELAQLAGALIGAVRVR